MQLHTIHTGNFKLDGGAMFGVVPKSIWHNLNPPDDNNMCNWAMRCLLVVTGNRRILIDTGIGTKQSEKFYGFYYLNGDSSLDKSLNNLGFEKSDITDVILTHLHFDHVGGAVEWNNERTAFQPAFPNATYHLAEEQWVHACNPNAREKASFLPENFMTLHERNVLNFVKPNEFLFSGLQCLVVNGHTNGMICPKIETEKGTVLYGADLFPSAAHIPVNYVMAYDIEPLVSMRERERMNQLAMNENWTIFLEHDLQYDFCTVIKNEKGQFIAGLKGNLIDLL